MDLFNTTKFDNHVDALLKEWHTPGLAIAVVQDDKISSRGFGRATLDPDKAVTANTLFDIASCSKSLTAGAVALLVEDEERYLDIKWDAKMSDLLPDDFVMAEESYTKDVTVEDILSHRTGLPRYDFVQRTLDGGRCSSVPVTICLTSIRTLHDPSLAISATCRSPSRSERPSSTAI